MLSYAPIARLTSLDDLEISGERLTDAGLIHLAGLTRLEFLRIDGGAITGAGLSHLRSMTRLRSLYLRGTHVENLDGLSGLAGLEDLNLDGTPINDAGLAAIAGMPRLTRLYLNQTRVTDDGLMHLASLPALKVLHLNHAPITRRHGLGPVRRPRGQVIYSSLRDTGLAFGTQGLDWPGEGAEILDSCLYPWPGLIHEPRGSHRDLAFLNETGEIESRSHRPTRASNHPTTTRRSQGRDDHTKRIDKPCS